MNEPFLNAREHVAELLGISTFRLQHHGDTFIDHAWCADVLTAFHGAAVLGVARAVDISQEPWKPIWLRSAIGLVSASGTVITSETKSIKTDLLLDADVTLDLFNAGESVSRDGVGYTLFVPHYDGSVTLRFANPDAAPYVELESRLLRMSQSLASKSADERLLAFISLWKTS
ncbi:MAG: hypothetical protein AAF497_03225 [Planctomycetota bacterium]